MNYAPQLSLFTRLQRPQPIGLDREWRQLSRVMVLFLATPKTWEQILSFSARQFEDRDHVDTAVNAICWAEERGRIEWMAEQERWVKCED